MLFPGVDEHRVVVRERTDAAAHIEKGIVAANFQQDVARPMSVRNKRAVHIEQRYATELALEYAKRP
jgi:hypothetical protein